MGSKAQAASLALAAQRSVPLRGAAAAAATQRRTQNRLVSRKYKHSRPAEAAAIARWGADAQQGESRMDRKEGQNL